jgi:hypothetical protein
MSGWTFSLSNIWAWTLYRRLPGASLAGGNRARMVPEVSFSNIFTFCMAKLYRCDAKPDNLDAGNALRQRPTKTKFLINNWNTGTLWSNFGVRADIVVSISFQMSPSQNSLKLNYSHSPPISLVPISMSYYRQISSTR